MAAKIRSRVRAFKDASKQPVNAEDDFGTKTLAQRIAAGNYRNEQSEGEPAAGGYTVAPIQEPTRQVLYCASTFRNLSTVFPMQSNGARIAEIATGVAVAQVNEAELMTPSDAAFDLVEVTAVKFGTRNVVTSELAEDSDAMEALGANIGNRLAFAEDQYCVGRLAAEISNTTTAAMANLTAGDLGGAMASVTIQTNGSRCWLMSPQVFGTIAGLLPGTAVYSGQPGSEWDGWILGHGVRFVPAMPAVPSTGQLIALFGDFEGGTYFGTKRFSVDVNQELQAINDAIEIIGIDRFGFAVSNRQDELLAAVAAE